VKQVRNSGFIDEVNSTTAGLPQSQQTVPPFNSRKLAHADIDKDTRRVARGGKQESGLLTVAMLMLDTSVDETDETRRPQRQPASRNSMRRGGLVFPGQHYLFHPVQNTQEQRF
jgi:hypothetical protein